MQLPKTFYLQRYTGEVEPANQVLLISIHGARRLTEHNTVELSSGKHYLE